MPCDSCSKNFRFKFCPDCGKPTNQSIKVETILDSKISLFTDDQGIMVYATLKNCEVLFNGNTHLSGSIGGFVLIKDLTFREMFKTLFGNFSPNEERFLRVFEIVKQNNNQGQPQDFAMATQKAKQFQEFLEGLLPKIIEFYFENNQISTQAEAIKFNEAEIHLLDYKMNQLYEPRGTLNGFPIWTFRSGAPELAHYTPHLRPLKRDIQKIIKERAPQRDVFETLLKVLGLKPLENRSEDENNIQTKLESTKDRPHG